MQRAPRGCEALFFSDTRSGNFLQQLVGIRAQHAQHAFAQFVGADGLRPIFQHAASLALRCVSGSLSADRMTIFGF